MRTHLTAWAHRCPAVHKCLMAAKVTTSVYRIFYMTALFWSELLRPQLPYSLDINVLKFTKLTSPCYDQRKISISAELTLTTTSLFWRTTTFLQLLNKHQKNITVWHLRLSSDLKEQSTGCTDEWNWAWTKSSESRKMTYTRHTIAWLNKAYDCIQCSQQRYAAAGLTGQSSVVGVPKAWNVLLSWSKSVSPGRNGT